MITKLVRGTPNRRALLGASAWLPFLPLIFPSNAKSQSSTNKTPHSHSEVDSHSTGMTTVGKVDHNRNGFDPMELLTSWETGKISIDANGQRIRTFEINALDIEIEIAPGIFFPAWTYNGQVPGPTLRATEGDFLRIHFTNLGSHPHSLHFHGIHNANMDGVAGAGLVSPGEEFTYEFIAQPYGCHLYHCHAVPLKRHIHKGLYLSLIHI